MADNHEQRVLHCWHGKGDDAAIDSPEYVEAILKPGTCMLPRGHEGPHVYTPDDSILINFPGSPQ